MSVSEARPSLSFDIAAVKFSALLMVKFLLEGEWLNFYFKETESERDSEIVAFKISRKKTYVCIPLIPFRISLTLGQCFNCYM